MKRSSLLPLVGIASSHSKWRCHHRRHRPILRQVVCSGIDDVSRRHRDVSAGADPNDDDDGRRRCRRRDDRHRGNRRSRPRATTGWIVPSRPPSPPPPMPMPKPIVAFLYRRPGMMATSSMSSSCVRRGAPSPCSATVASGWRRPAPPPSVVMSSSSSGGGVDDEAASSPSTTIDADHRARRRRRRRRRHRRRRLRPPVVAAVPRCPSSRPP